MQMFNLLTLMMLVTLLLATFDTTESQMCKQSGRHCVEVRFKRGNLKGKGRCTNYGERHCVMIANRCRCKLDREMA